MDENLGREQVKGGFYPSRQTWKIAPVFPGKMTAFSVLTLLFHLSLLKMWPSHPHKSYISEMRNNRAIC